MYAFLGNHDAAVAVDALDKKGEPVRNDEGVALQRMEPLEGKLRTFVEFPEGHAVRDAVKDVTNSGGVWASHSTEGDNAPAWVASDNPQLAQALASYYECEIREPLPEGENGEFADSHVAGRIASLLGPTLSLILGLALLLALRLGLVDLRTNAGTDWLSGIMGNATATNMTHMALSATSGESAAHTSLAGEIATASGGLIRKAFTYAHTNGTSTWTATATFTANGNDSLPVSVVQLAIFNASSSGTMGFEKIVTSATFTTTGDAVTYTYTITP